MQPDIAHIASETRKYWSMSVISYAVFGIRARERLRATARDAPRLREPALTVDSKPSRIIAGPKAIRQAHAWAFDSGLLLMVIKFPFFC